MNDQTSPTAAGQRQDPPRDPFQAPLDAQGLEPVPSNAPGRGKGDGRGSPVRRLLRERRADLTAAGVLILAGVVAGVLGGLAWYRFAPTVWLSIPAASVGQVTRGVDQSALLANPEAKGIASVDGYFFVVTAVACVLLGILAFFLARRGSGEGSGGAGIGAWAGLLLGSLAATGIAAALGRWISLSDPLTVLRTIAGGHDFHAPVALHTQGLFVLAPLLGMVLYFALALSFTRPAPPPQWLPYGDRQVNGQQGYFTQENPYGLPPMPTTGGDTPAPWPTNAQLPTAQPSTVQPPTAQPPTVQSGPPQF